MEFDLDQQFDHGELLLSERRCRVCGSIKNLIEGFYITHKNSTHLPSSYSYECKSCTVARVTASRKKDSMNWVYPDW
jgi:hypothetical protein